MTPAEPPALPSTSPQRRKRPAALAAGHITLPYAPRPAFLPFHERRQRFAVLVCHRRAGKTVATINDLVRRAVECERPAPRYAYIAARSAREIETRLAAAIERLGDRLDRAFEKAHS